MKNKTILIAMLAAAMSLFGCQREANVASYNLSKDADEFRIMRRITVLNTFSDTALYSIEGNCSISTEPTKLALTCKQGANEYKKHFVLLSDNVTTMIEQLDWSAQNPYRFKIIFKPKQVFSIPNLEIK